MSDLILILNDCFPRGCFKNQTEYRKMFETLMQLTIQNFKNIPSIKNFVCEECKQIIDAKKTVVLKHLSTHSLYK